MKTLTWQAFVVAHGHKARTDHLAHVLGKSAAAIDRLRGAAVKRGSSRDFADLFAQWHGRPPRDEEWPAPVHRGGHRSGYEWQLPDYQLIASLVGHVGIREMQEALTARLRRITGNPAATRSKNTVQCALNRLGLQSRDVLGGIALADAGRQLGGSVHALYHDIAIGRLTARRVGQQLVLDRGDFAKWKAAKTLPPKGYVRLASIRPALGIASDAHLPEYASLGYIPTAIRCNPYGEGTGNTQYGTWYVDRKVARKIVADRRAGRPMPWFGKPSPCNVRATWRKLSTRWHPDACEDCRAIWGPAGRPRTFEDYARRYPPLAHGAKRHLSRVWSWGLSIAEVTAQTRTSESTVRRAIAGGYLRARRGPRGRQFITRTDATRWQQRKCPIGKTTHSWMSIASACKEHALSRQELESHIAAGRLRVKLGDFGAMRGVRYVLRHQVAMLREETGYSETEAARRVGVSVPRLRVLLRGLEWRPAPSIPKAVVDAAKKRKYSSPGYTLAEAARRLRKSRAWLEQQVYAGAVRVLCPRWDCTRRYVSAPAFARLQQLARQRKPKKPQRLTAEWMSVSFAAHLAGVTVVTLMRWGAVGDVRTRDTLTGKRYHRRSVMARARKYWRDEVRFKRDDRRPAWLEGATAA